MVYVRQRDYLEIIIFKLIFIYDTAFSDFYAEKIFC